jgi:hypothetical protein
MLGNYFGFFHGGLTDLWISRGFWGKGKIGVESGEFSVGKWHRVQGQIPTQAKTGLQWEPCGLFLIVSDALVCCILDWNLRNRNPCEVFA